MRIAKIWQGMAAVLVALCAMVLLFPLVGCDNNAGGGGSNTNVPGGGIR